MCKNNKLFNNPEDVKNEVGIFGNGDILIPSHLQNVIPIAILIPEKADYSSPFPCESRGTRGNFHELLNSSLVQRRHEMADKP